MSSRTKLDLIAGARRAERRASIPQATKRLLTSRNGMQGMMFHLDNTGRVIVSKGRRKGWNTDMIVMTTQNVLDADAFCRDMEAFGHELRSIVEQSYLAQLRSEGMRDLESWWDENTLVIKGEDDGWEMEFRFVD